MRRRRHSAQPGLAIETLESRLLLAAPVVVDDMVQTTAGTAAAISALANDSDADGNALSIIGYNSVTSGTVSQNGNTLTFTPNAGFVGQDSFLYTVSDGTGNQVTGSIVVTVNPVGGVQATRPFGQHVEYAAGTILPSHRTQAQLDDDVRTFYNTWKSRYLVSAGTVNSQPLYRIAFGLGSSETVSEGQGFGMVITALLAGHDPNAKQYFDGLWRFSRQNPSTIDSRLMDWHTPTHDGDDSAFDGDADIAYGLLLADAQWGSGGAINYAAEAATVIAGIYESTIGPASHLPELGDWVSANGSPYSQWTPRSSDFMPSYFRAFGRATNNTANWNVVVAASQAVIDSIQANYSPATGLLPDFIVSANTSPRPAAADFLEGPNDGAYSYNAGRDPLRIGLDGLLNGDATSIAEVRRISNWAQSTTGGNPASFRAGYQLNGTPVSGSNYFTTFFVAPLGVAAMTDAAQQNWLNAIYDSVYNTVEDYYEDTVTLLSLAAMTGNLWDPTATGDAPAVPVSLRANADAHVRAGSYANRNYGPVAQLNVRNHTTASNIHESFLRFDLTGLVGTIESAVLKLTPKSIGSQMKSGGEFRIRLLTDATDAWVEGNGGADNSPANEIRWNNRPTGSGAEVRVAGAGLVVNSARSIDVTALVAQAMNANRVASFHLDVPTASSSRYVYFYSDEYSKAAYRPALDVTLRNGTAVLSRVAEGPINRGNRAAGPVVAARETDRVESLTEAERNETPGAALVARLLTQVRRARRRT